MNARKTILFLGIIALVALAVLVAVSIFFHSKLEKEKNKSKTDKAREARWKDKAITAGMEEEKEQGEQLTEQQADEQSK